MALSAEERKFGISEHSYNNVQPSRTGVNHGSQVHSETHETRNAATRVNYSLDFRNKDFSNEDSFHKDGESQSIEERARDDYNLSHQNGIDLTDFDVYQEPSLTHHVSNLEPYQLQDYYPSYFASSSSRVDARIVQQDPYAPSSSGLTSIPSFLKQDVLIARTPFANSTASTLVQENQNSILDSRPSSFVTTSLLTSSNSPAQPQSSISPALQQQKRSDSSHPIVSKVQSQQTAKFYIAVPGLPAGLTKADYRPISDLPVPRTQTERSYSTSTTAGKEMGTRKRKRSETLTTSTSLVVKKSRCAEKKSEIESPLPSLPVASTSKQVLESDREEIHHSEYVSLPSVLVFDCEMLENQVPTSSLALMVSTRFFRQLDRDPLSQPPSGIWHTQEFQDSFVDDSVPPQHDSPPLDPHQKSSPASSGPRAPHPLPYSSSLDRMLAEPSPPHDDRYIPSMDDAIYGDGSSFPLWMSGVPDFGYQSSFSADGTVDPSLLSGAIEEQPWLPSPSLESMQASSSSFPQHLRYFGWEAEADVIRLDKTDSMYRPVNGNGTAKSGQKKDGVKRRSRKGKERMLESEYSAVNASSSRSRESLFGDDSGVRAKRHRGRGRWRGGNRREDGHSRSTPIPQSRTHSPSPHEGRQSGKSLVLQEQEKVYCHQCRNANDAAEKMTCTNMLAEGEPCRRKYCILCILKRYPDIEFNTFATVFTCPTCTNTCNCTKCCADRNEPYISTRHVKIDKETVQLISSGEAPGTLPSASAEFVRLSKAMQSSALNTSNIGNNAEIEKDSIQPSRRPIVRASLAPSTSNKPSARNEKAKGALLKTRQFIENYTEGSSGTYWGTIFSVNGRNRIGSGFIGASGSEIVVQGLQPAVIEEGRPKTPMRKKRRIYIGKLQADWGIDESGEEIQPDKPDRKGKEKSKVMLRQKQGQRQYVGDVSALLRYRDASRRRGSSFADRPPVSPPPSPPPIDMDISFPGLSQFDPMDLSDRDAEGEDDDEYEQNHWVFPTTFKSSSPIRPPNGMSAEQVEIAVRRAVDAFNVVEP